MRTKPRSLIAILTGGTKPNTVVKQRSQIVVLVPWNIHAFIQDDPCDLLAVTRLHAARLPVPDLEPLVMNDCRDEHPETTQAMFEVSTSGNDHIVRISRIVGSDFLCEGGESTIEPVCGQICERRRSWSTLRQMP